MNILNYTPHPIKVVNPDKSLTEFTSHGIARCAAKSEKVAEVDGIPCFTTKYGQVENLPEQKPGVVLIVSALVRTQLPERLDLLSPSGLVRDDKGNVIGCQGFDTNGIQRIGEQEISKDRQAVLDILNGTGKQENFTNEHQRE
ncbi:MAG: hypothetical protein IAE94_09680 [Chthoniobacterales bacterium]|nr:hypothetical protein [Chthoniobacterales bacterium]